MKEKINKSGEKAFLRQQTQDSDSTAFTVKFSKTGR